MLNVCSRLCRFPALFVVVKQGGCSIGQGRVAITAALPRVFVYVLSMTHQVPHVSHSQLPGVSRGRGRVGLLLPGLMKEVSCTSCLACVHNCPCSATQAQDASKHRWNCAEVAQPRRRASYQHATQSKGLPSASQMHTQPVKTAIHRQAVF